MNKLGLTICLMSCMGSAAFAAPSVESRPAPGFDTKVLLDSREEVDEMDMAMTEDNEMSFATDPSNEAAMVRETCNKVGLAPEQKEALRTHCFNTKSKKADAAAGVKKAKIEYMRALTDPSGDKGKAEATSQALINAKSALCSLKTGAMNVVLYDILKPEQRQPALQCMSAMMNLKKQQAKEGRDD
jgi:hypothetical protein